MSELIAEARVLVTPDTTAFRPALIAQLATVTKGVTVPINVVPVATGGNLTAQTAVMGALLSQIRQEAERTQGAQDALRQQTEERRRATKAAADQARQLGQLRTGAASAALSFAGLRGATLAAGGAFLTGAAAVVAFGKALQGAAQFETSLNVFQATTDATAQSMERIADLSRDLGRDLTLPGVTAQSAADALSGLSRAGLSVEDSMAGVRGTLQLATAAAIDNEQAVTLVANALNAFKLQGEDATRVADLFAAASKQSQGSIVDVGLAFQQSAAAAAQAGVSVEDTIALLTQLGRAGLRGSDAGTSLRVALLRLINPAKNAREAIEGLGVAVRDQQGNIRPEVFAEITQQLQGFTRAQQDATLATIFGQDAFRAAAIIGREGATGLNEMRTATQEAGVAADLAAARTQGLAGSVENLKNQLSGLGQEIGGAFSGPAAGFLDVLAGGIQNIVTGLGFLDSALDFRFPGSRVAADVDVADEAVERISARFDELRSIADTPQQIKMFDEIEKGALESADRFAFVVVEAGKMRTALEARGSEAGAGLVEEEKKLTKELEDSASAALKARDATERYAVGLSDSQEFAKGLTFETKMLNEQLAAFPGLVNRADESLDRFASTLETTLTATPTLPDQGPTPIGPTARIEGLIQIAQAQGDLTEVLRLQKILRDNAQKAFDQSKGNVEQRTKQLGELRSRQAAVIQTEKQIAAEQESASKERIANAEKEAKAAQQEFLARQANARAQQQNRISQAQQSKGLADDIREQKDMAALLAQQIAAIRASTLTEAQKRDAITALVSATIATTGEIKNLVKAQKEQRDANRQAILDRTSENAALRTQIAESRGASKDVIAAFIDAEIVAAQARLREAKRLGKATLPIIAEIEDFKEKKRDLLKAASEDEGDGLTVADILRENAETFIRTGGSLITGDQPFAGPTGFTADVAQFLRRPSTRVEMVEKPASETARVQRLLNENIVRLADVIEANTAAQTGGNSSTASGVIPGSFPGASFYKARQARQIAEARSGI